MRFKSILVIGVTVAASFAAAQQPRPQMQSSHAPAAVVVARVNDTPLFERDLNAQMQQLFPYFSLHGGQVPPSAMKELRQKAMDRVVLEELVYQEAKRRGIQVTTAQVDARIKTARAKAESPEQFEATVARSYGSHKEFRRYVERALMVEKLWDLEITRPSRQTDAAALKYYRENKDKFVRPESVELQTISFQFPENPDAATREAARKKAEDMLPKAKAAATREAFGALAEKYSTDDWRVMNGDHGWIHRGTVEQELDSAFKMKAGEVSGVIASKAGYHILRVNGYKAAESVTFAEVKVQLKQSLQKEAETRLRAQFENKIRQSAKVEVR